MNEIVIPRNGQPICSNRKCGIETSMSGPFGFMPRRLSERLLYKDDKGIFQMKYECQECKTKYQKELYDQSNPCFICKKPKNSDKPMRCDNCYPDADIITRSDWSKWRKSK